MELPDVNNLNEKVSDACALIIRVIAEHDTCEAEKKKLSDARDLHLAHVNSLTTERNDMRNTLADLQKIFFEEHASFKKEISDLKSSVRSLENECSELREERDALKRKYGESEPKPSGSKKRRAPIRRCRITAEWNKLCKQHTY
jgi:chromosome segregation ATPase